MAGEALWFYEVRKLTGATVCGFTVAVRPMR
jgi:hypothetical protein